MKKQIPNFPDYYVHSDGYVISHKNGKKRILFGGPAGKSRKYRQVLLCQNGKSVGKLIHILVAQAFVENPEKLPQVNHVDGNPKNNNFRNLEWSTPKNNMRHAVDEGLYTRPTDEHFEIMRKNAAKSKALFTLEEGSDIIEMKSSLGLSNHSMAEIVGCSVSTIKRLARNDISTFKNGVLQ